MSAVLAVVLMVLKIIGMILLALLLLLLLALLLPAGIHFRWSHIGGLRLQLCYGPLHFTLYPRKADEEEKRQKQSRGTRPKPSRLPPHRPSQPRRLQKRRKNPKKQNRPRPLKRNRENQKHRKHPRSRNRQYQNQKPNLPRQRKHLPRNHSRKKIPALWTASKRQSGRTLLAMCGTCSACCAPVRGRCCAASASAS